MTVPIDFIIGLPPDNLLPNTNTVVRNSMPLCRISPGVPSFTEGITLFKRRPLFVTEEKNKNETSYLKLLESEGYTLNQFANQRSKNGNVLIAFQADSFPTDSFTNEYGENFLQSFTDVASEKAASLMQIMGKRSAGEAITGFEKSLRGSESMAARGIGKGMKFARETAEGVLNALPPSVAGGVNLVSSLAAGSRIDFPMLWKSSGFQPSYTMTVRLYNPNPADPDVTNKYIIGPIAALMLLGIPISQDGKTYSWPFIHKIEAPGIYNLDPAFISNITVIKGGDQQQISYQQRMGVVDVRIDFGSLFNSILAGRKSEGRPTLHSYLKGMKTQKSGVQNFSTREHLSDYQIESELDRIKAGYTSITKERAPTVDEITDEEKQNPPSRVSTAVKNVADSIINQIPTGFKISTS